MRPLDPTGFGRSSAVTVRLPVKLLEELQKRADNTEQSLSQIVRWYVSLGLSAEAEIERAAEEAQRDLVREIEGL